MSGNSKLPEQLSLPFGPDSSVKESAKVFFLSEHRPSSNTASNLEIPLSEEKQRQILDKVLERAERLTWFK